MSGEKQTYKYIIQNSILNDNRVEVQLESAVEYLFFKFFVLYTPCSKISRRSRSLEEYGWSGKINAQNGLQKSLIPIIDLSSNHFIFTDKDDLAERFDEKALVDFNLSNVDIERCVIGITAEQNKLLKLLRHIRNCLAHGKYIVIKNSKEEPTMIMQDNNHNVTARIVLRVSTLIGIIKVIDKNNLVCWKEILVQTSGL